MSGARPNLVFDLIAIALYGGLIGLTRRFEAAGEIERVPSVGAAGASWVIACVAGAILCMVDRRVAPGLREGRRSRREPRPSDDGGALSLRARPDEGSSGAGPSIGESFCSAVEPQPRRSSIGCRNPDRARIEILGMFDDRMGARRPSPIAGRGAAWKCRGSHRLRAPYTGRSRHHHPLAHGRRANFATDRQIMGAAGRYSPRDGFQSIAVSAGRLIPSSAARRWWTFAIARSRD